MQFSIDERMSIRQVWDELSEVLGFNEFIDPTSQVVKDFQEIDDELKRRREAGKIERPTWYYQEATRAYPKGFRWQTGVGVAKAIREERIGVPLERFECFYEAETEVIQEAVKENFGVPGYMSYRDACNVDSWY